MSVTLFHTSSPWWFRTTTFQIFRRIWGFLQHRIWNWRTKETHVYELTKRVEHNRSKLVELLALKQIRYHETSSCVENSSMTFKWWVNTNRLRKRKLRKSHPLRCSFFPSHSPWLPMSFRACTAYFSCNSSEDHCAGHLSLVWSFNINTDTLSYSMLGTRLKELSKTAMSSKILCISAYVEMAWLICSFFDFSKPLNFWPMRTPSISPEFVMMS